LQFAFLLQILRKAKAKLCTATLIESGQTRNT